MVITVANETITVRLSPKDIETINRSIDEGLFTSRSDLVRYSVRHTLMQMNESERRFELIKDFAKGKKIPRGAVNRSLKGARRKVHREVYGDD
ncbi:MAG: ribbon-helix-helix domain-containing protein [Candidatus Thermoplasmatota archaeon]|jgi:Arc/MetJ-type ribon-helix-helix transcriptional regulator|nr:ribbon-helix-helix domain-containing protein [Candidatus Thermoplasmatota archaeon]